MKTLVKTLAIILCCLVALPFVVLEVVCIPKVTNKILEYVPDYMQAEAEVGKLDYQLSSWPNVGVKLHDLVIYTHIPAVRDTLLAVDTLDVALDVMAFLNENKVNIDHAYAKGLLVNAQTIGGQNNWDVFPASAEEDTTATAMPEIRWKNVAVDRVNVTYKHDSAQFQVALDNFLLHSKKGAFTQKAIIAGAEIGADQLLYSANPHTLYAVGKFSTKLIAANSARGTLLKTDLQMPHVCLHDAEFSIDSTACTLKANVTADTTFRKFNVEELALTLDNSSVSAAGYAEIVSKEEIYTDLALTLSSPKIENIIALAPKSVVDMLQGIRLQGAISADATAKGYFDGKEKLPVVNLNVDLKNIKGSAPERNAKLDQLDLKAKARYNQNSKDSTFVQVDNFYVKTGRSYVKLNANAHYKKGKEYLKANVKGDVDLYAMNKLYPFLEKGRIRGVMSADLSAYFFLEDVTNMNVSQIHTNGTVTGDDVRVSIPSERLSLNIDSLRIKVNTNTGVASRRTNQVDTSLVNSRLAFSNLTLRYKRAVKADVDRLSMLFYADDLSGNKAPRLRASVSLRGIDAQTKDTVRFKAKRISASANISPDKEYKFVPTSAVRLSFDSVIFASKKAGMMLDSTRIQAAVTPNFRKYRRGKKGQKPVLIPVSEQKVINTDSLYRLVMGVMEKEDVADEFLKNFKATGKISLKKFNVRDAYFPLPMTVRKVDVEFDGDTLNLDNFRMRVGRSAITLNGEVNNVRRFLLRGRTLNGDLNLKSRRIDINQLMRAYTVANETATQHKQLSADANVAMLEAESEMDADIESTAAIDSTMQASLIVIPKNLNLSFNADVDSVLFSNMKLIDFAGRVKVKDQHVSVANLSTSTKVGKLAMHLSYLCKDLQKADAALALNMDSVQIGELVTALPELDSIMPMLRSFDGSVACEASLTATLDSAMNVVLPSVNAGAWLRGDSLVLMDGETFSEIAKMLMFSKKTRNVIDSVSVELLVKNNEIEIYPFMVAMDKYRLGVGGKQGLDQSFNYHIALLKPIRLGLDVYGKDFDHIKFKLASVKFKDSNTKIGKGGVLIREEEVNVREIFHNKVINDILTKNK
jgi:hypothetical protein